jgi:hypothetical protein
MWDRRTKLGTDDYDRAFREALSGEGVLDYETVEHYLRADPVNAVYLWEKFVDASRTALKKWLVGVPTTQKYIMYSTPPEYIPRNVVLPYFEKWSALGGVDNPVANEMWISGSCLFCGSRAQLPIYSVGYRDRAIQMYMFETSSYDVSIALESFCKTNRLPLNVTSILGLCRQCHRPCTECGVKMGARPSLADLTSYQMDARCSGCNTDNITKLQTPKPNSKELRGYRARFLTLGKVGSSK